jgi:hypothetical protein
MNEMLEITETVENTGVAAKVRAESKRKFTFKAANPSLAGEWVSKIQNSKFDRPGQTGGGGGYGGGGGGGDPRI